MKYITLGHLSLLVDWVKKRSYKKAEVDRKIESATKIGPTLVRDENGFINVAQADESNPNFKTYEWYGEISLPKTAVLQNDVTVSKKNHVLTDLVISIDAKAKDKIALIGTAVIDYANYNDIGNSFNFQVKSPNSAWKNLNLIAEAAGGDNANEKASGSLVTQTYLAQEDGTHEFRLRFKEVNANQKTYKAKGCSIQAVAKRKMKVTVYEP